MKHAFDGWIPIRIYAGPSGHRVDWCYFGERRLTESFFRESVAAALQDPFNLAFRQDTPIDALLEWAEQQPGIEPTAFIYHATRCGSTLLARMLMALPTHVIVSEPPMLDSVLRAHYFLPTFDSDIQTRWVRATISALAQRRDGSESRFVVKLDAWNITECALMRRAFPDVPWIFLYRDPIEIAVSQTKMAGALMVPGMVGPSLALIPAAEAATMRRAEFMARIIGRILDAGHAECLAGGGRAVHYSELPDALWTSLAEVFKVATDDSTIATLRDAARPDAKNPHFEFVADTDSKQRAADAELRDAITHFATPAFRALEELRMARLESPRVPARLNTNPASHSVA